MEPSAIEHFRKMRQKQNRKGNININNQEYT